MFYLLLENLKLCKRYLEEEYHFDLVCPHFEDIRKIYQKVLPAKARCV